MDMAMAQVTAWTDPPRLARHCRILPDHGTPHACVWCPAVCAVSPVSRAASIHARPARERARRPWDKPPSTFSRRCVMPTDTPAYGLWFLVVLNAAVFIIFAFSFTHPRSARDWRSFGAFAAFLVALFTEMYGFPLTI